jgi:hypothetical protein
VAAYQEAGPQPSVHQTADPQTEPRSSRVCRPPKGACRNPFDVERVFGPGGTIEDWEPAIAVDPSDPSRVYMVSTRFGGPPACGSCVADPVLVMRRSTDGGSSWGSDQFICGLPCAATTDQDDPQIEVATDGSVFVAWLESFVPGVSFTKSTDHGATWSTPINVAPALPGGTDKPWLTISPSGQNVYIGFNDSDSYVVSSHDGGASFSSPLKTSSDTSYWFAEGGAVAPNGDVYVAESAEPASGTNLELLRSTNGGASFTTTLMGTSANGPACGGGCISDFLYAQSSVAVDPNGRIVYVYVANAAAKANKTLYSRTSSDGVTWTTPQVVSNAGDNNFPQVVAAGPNDFRMAWMSNSNGAALWNVWWKRSSDGGTTWTKTPKLASNAGAGASYKSELGFAFPYGDYFDMAVGPGGRTWLAWGEGASYSGAGGVWYTRSRR